MNTGITEINSREIAVCMGKPIAQNTEKLWLNEGIFYIKVKSPVWKSELQMARMKIKSMINEQVGRELVEEVRVF